MRRWNLCVMTPHTLCGNSDGMWPRQRHAYVHGKTTGDRTPETSELAEPTPTQTPARALHWIDGAEQVKDSTGGSRCMAKGAAATVMAA